jgi:hypothetical protein
MNLRARLDRLERALRPGTCSECHGVGRASVALVFGDDAPAIRGCPACGRIAANVKIVRIVEREAA